MKIETLVVGYLKENCYVITKNNKSIIIDPGDEADKIINHCKDKTIVGVLITHHHFDHVGALKEIEAYFKVKESTNVSGFDFEVIDTPGHTSDSKSFYFKDDNVMFTGDFLFKGTVGRMDLPTGSEIDMKKSLEKIESYADDIKIYPGHGDTTILGREKPYFTYYLI